MKNSILILPFIALSAMVFSTPKGSVVNNMFGTKEIVINAPMQDDCFNV